MKKVSLKVMIPAVGKRHDFLIPDSMGVLKAIQLMALALSDEYGVSQYYSDLTLIDTRDHMALNNSCSLKQMGITNGAELILV